MLEQWQGYSTLWPKKFGYNIRRIKPYTSDTNVEDMTPENMYDDVNILLLVISFHIILHLEKKVYNLMSMEKLTLSHPGCAHDF